MSYDSLIRRLKEQLLALFKDADPECSMSESFLPEVFSILDQHEALTKGGEYRVERNGEDCYIYQGKTSMHCLVIVKCSDYQVDRLMFILNSLTKRVEELDEVISDGFDGYKKSIEKPLIAENEKLRRLETYCKNIRQYVENVVGISSEHDEWLAELDELLPPTHDKEPHE